MARTNVTIKDVAREASVSVATVSRALNGHENVAEGVRKHVMEIANRLRYQPHAAARSLSSRRTQTIGVVLPDLYGEFFSELIRGIDVVARASRQHLLVSSYHGHPEEQGEALRAMRGRVDGLLVLSPYADRPGFLTDNLPTSLPAVLINTHLPDA
ncbi:MAG: LacI family DNA-binding transcriptional regulator, partial [Pseudoxanthomonas sp.]